MDDARWDHRFAVPGVQGNVLAMAFDKKHIYVAGLLQSVGPIVADGVAHFNGKHWEELPDGPRQNPFSINVYALEMFKDRLYAGGAFTNVAGQAAGGLACWDGKRWTIPGGANGVVYALQADKHSLLVAGRFMLPGGTNPVALARWDGHKWTVLQSQLPPCNDGPACVEAIVDIQSLPSHEIVSVLEIHGFPSFGLPIYLLARYEPRRGWSSFPGPDGSPIGVGVYSLTRYRGLLVAGGDFQNVADPALHNVALWDGGTWQPLGEGLEGQVFGVAANDSVLYALHEIGGADGLGRAGVSRWDGKQWTRLGVIQGNVSRLFLSPENELYVTGFFAGVDSVVAPGLARWNGRNWEALFDGVFEGVAGANSVRAFTEHQGMVFMGGIFESAGRETSQGIASWDGALWRNVGGSIMGPTSHRIATLASSGSLLFAGGFFTNIGNTAAVNLASWDGTHWQALAGGVVSNVAKLLWWENSLYVGGRFQGAGETAAANIARWDGAGWHPVGSGCNSNVAALAVWHESLYAGGSFAGAGDVPVSRVARWDGTHWHDVGGGISGNRAAVSALAAGDDGLYVGGQFTSAGGVPARSIARWDGTNWHPLAEGWRGSVTALAVRDRVLYAGGRLTNSSGQTVGGVLRWDGNRWETLGSGVSDPRAVIRVFALLAREHEVFTGGIFTLAGGKPSANVARWIEQSSAHIAMTKHSQNPRLRMAVSADPGLRLRFESSQDLRNWSTIHRDELEEGEWSVDPGKTSGARFFRVVPMP